MPSLQIDGVEIGHIDQEMSRVILKIVAAHRGDQDGLHEFELKKPRDDVEFNPQRPDRITIRRETPIMLYLKLRFTKVERFEKSLAET
jgi:hypothetical protein